VKAAKARRNKRKPEYHLPACLIAGIVALILAAGEANKKRMRAALESLLRARKLDVTLTTAASWSDTPVDRLAPTGCADLDAALGGGLRR